jgi:hypothetical protein
MKDVIKLVLFLLTIVVLFRATGKLFAILQADYYYKRSQVNFNNGEFMVAHSYSEKALRLNDLEPDYHIQKAKTLIGRLSSDEITAADLKREAHSEIVKAFSLNGMNLVTKRNAVPLFYFLALVYTNNSGVNNEFDEQYLELAKNYYLELSKDYFNDVGVVSQVAIYQKKLGLTEDYGNSTGRIRELRPDLLDWYID